jgi:hypothetical protein
MRQACARQERDYVVETRRIELPTFALRTLVSTLNATNLHEKPQEATS